MQKRMGEAVARVARKVNETVENKTDSLELECHRWNWQPMAGRGCKLRCTLIIFPPLLIPPPLSSLPPTAELNLAGNYLHRLPEEVTSLLHLRAIDLSRNRFRRFPEPLTTVAALETIDLEENEI
ncbi:LRC20 protein, partial [Glareola pratincola]|nr:LRC20 protein [Glareola pratincola]